MSETDLESGDAQFFEIDESLSGVRIDKGLSEISEEFSRARIQKLIEGGNVFLNGDVCFSASVKLSAGDEIIIEVPPLQESVPKAQNIPLEIVYEDSDLLVINKQAGLVVHPGAGNHDGTLVNALLHHCGDELSGIGGVLRPGIVHRLDKDTSGLMVAAKNDRAHQGLSAQLEDRSLSRAYKALVLGIPMPRKGTVDQPIGRDHRNRQKMAINRKYGRAARTAYELEDSYGGVFSLLSCKLETGRTHQIRVHMGFIKLPLIGDPLYGPQPTAVASALKKGGYDDAAIAAVQSFNRQALHAQALSFIHPCTDERLSFTAPFPDDMAKLLKMLKNQ
jgi:23S rRNA pseudouridine1911/1915/1917 synthase